MNLSKQQREMVEEKLSELNEKRIERSDTIATNQLKCDDQNHHFFSEEELERHNDDYWQAVDEIEATDPQIVSWNETMHKLYEVLK